MALAEAIAIVGMGCRLPGGVNDWLTFWELLSLRTGSSGSSGSLESRSVLQPYPSAWETQEQVGGYLDSLADFDPELLGYHLVKRPVWTQQRLLLESSFRAVEDAGKRLDQLAGARPLRCLSGYPALTTPWLG